VLVYAVSFKTKKVVVLIPEKINAQQPGLPLRNLLLT